MFTVWPVGTKRGGDGGEVGGASGLGGGPLTGGFGPGGVGLVGALGESLHAMPITSAKPTP
jgi:hypothetical protein